VLLNVAGVKLTPAYRMRVLNVLAASLTLYPVCISFINGAKVFIFCSTCYKGGQCMVVVCCQGSRVYYFCIFLIEFERLGRWVYFGYNSCTYVHNYLASHCMIAGLGLCVYNLFRPSLRS